MCHDEWTCKFTIIKHKSKALCCICNKVITVRFNNINRHFENNHSNLGSMQEDEKLESIQKEVKRYKQPTNSFKKNFKPKSNISAASFQVSNTIDVYGKPLSNGDYIKKSF